MDVANDCVECACEFERALENAWKILTASKARNFVAVQIAPAVRVSIGEKFGLSRGEDGVGKVVAALKMLGADVVVDTAIASDALTLLRLKQLKANKEAGAGAVFSSECSAWTSHAKEKYPEIELLPTATSVCAKLLKKYYGEKEEGKRIRVIALEMGKAKKCDPGVDLVLTLDELGVLINALELNIRLLKKQPLTAPLGIGSGAAYIAAASGGDAEGIARCLTKEKTQLNYRRFEYSGLYGKSARREAIITIDGTEWRFAVAETLEAADAVLADIKAGARYDYVEVKACAGGQIGVGCDLETEEGEMTKRLRHLGLKYLDRGRAARSAEMSAAAELVLKDWNKLCRSGEADAYDEIEEIVEDFDPPVEEIVEEVVEEAPIEEIVEEVVEEAPVEEIVEEVVEEAPVEEIVEEVVEEAPIEEIVEEVALEEVIEVTDEIVTIEEVIEEEIPEEDVLDEQIEEVLDVFEEVIEVADEVVPVEEAVDEVALEEVVEEAPIEEIVEEVVEEAPIEEIVEEVVEEAPIEEIVEEVVEEAPVEEIVEEVVEEAPVEEIVEEVVEEAPIEEVVEEVALEEVVEEAVIEEVVEEAAPVVEEVAVAEETTEEAQIEEALEVFEEAVREELEEAEAEEALEEKIDYSKMDRRKIKRLKKKNKKK